MRRVIRVGIPVFALLYALAVINYGAYYFGRDWKLEVLFILIPILVVVYAVIAVYRWRLRELLRALPRHEIAELREDAPEVDEFARAEPMPNERRDWLAMVSNVLAMPVSLFYLPLLYTIVRRDPLSGDAPFTGVHVLLMCAGFASWVALRRYQVAHYRCPRCGGAVERLREPHVRVECAACDIVWRLD